MSKPQGTGEKTVEAKARIMPRREMATDDLFGLALAALSRLKALMTRRSHRDAACVALTNLSVGIQFLGERLASLTFDERPPSALDDEAEEKRQHAGEATLADLFAEPEAKVGSDIAYVQGKLCSCCRPQLAEVMCTDCMEALERLSGNLEELRKDDFAEAMGLFCRGAKDINEVAKRIVTVMQSTMPGLLQEHFGVSLTSVGERIGEGRQTTRERKKRLVEKTLKNAGMKGYKGLGGARSEQHREACRKAQLGNSSRARGEEKKRSS